ncbi:MAG: ABC transporter permease [bacterium]|nr:ABC transporter permease [bacterium]
MEAAVLSVAGGLIGIAVGIGGARLAARLIRHLPVATSWWGIGLAFGFSLAVGLFFGMWPARRAARMEPVAALRYESPGRVPASLTVETVVPPIPSYSPGRLMP